MSNPAQESIDRQIIQDINALAGNENSAITGTLPRVSIRELLAELKEEKFRRRLAKVRKKLKRR